MVYNQNDLNSFYSQAHGSIRKGLLNGLWTYWDNEGNLLETKNYNNGTISGEYTSYHNNGRKLSNGQVMGSNENGNMIMDGKWSFWNKDGSLIEEVEYSNGLRNGITKYFSAGEKHSAEILYQKEFHGRVNG